MKKKPRCPQCNKKLKFKKPDSILPDGAYYCKHCPDLYKPVVRHIHPLDIYLRMLDFTVIVLCILSIVIAIKQVT